MPPIARCWHAPTRSPGRRGREDEFRDSAIRAYQWAKQDSNSLVKQWLGGDGNEYRFEETAVDGAMQFKAALNLYSLTGEQKYLDDMAALESDFVQTVDNLHWDRSSFFLLELMLDDNQHTAQYRAYFAERVTGLADQRLAETDNYAYRQPWWQVDSGWYHAMGWGNWHPLRRSRIFVAAHFISGQRQYLDAAYLANDYQMGANPMGRSMTSGLGTVYPATFLDLASYADGHEEFVPGITPYQLDFSIHYDVKQHVFGIKVPAREDHNFAGIDVNFFTELESVMPVWRRFGNIEGRSVPQDEYSIWETISPAVGVTAYLMGDHFMPSDALKNRTPKRFEDMAGSLPTP
jgi:endoglucanase